MEMTAAVQYILTAAQSLCSKDYYKKFRMTILGLAGVLFCENGQYRQNGSLYVSKKILTWMLREARRGLKATVGNRVKPDYHFTHIVFVPFCFFQQSPVFPCRLCLKAC